MTCRRSSPRFFRVMILLGLTAMCITGCQPPNDTAAEPAGPREEQIVPAAPGVGAKGQKLREQNGILSSRGAALFDAQQRVVFEIQIPHSLKLYEAEHGRKPKSHEEFMEKIIDANMIKLPELPEGHSYFYDPATGELMVRQPAVGETETGDK